MSETRCELALDFPCLTKELGVCLNAHRTKCPMDYLPITITRISHVKMHTSAWSGPKGLGRKAMRGRVRKSQGQNLVTFRFMPTILTNPWKIFLQMEWKKIKRKCEIFKLKIVSIIFHIFLSGSLLKPACIHPSRPPEGMKEANVMIHTLTTVADECKTAKIQIIWKVTGVLIWSNNTWSDI